MIYIIIYIEYVIWIWILNILQPVQKETGPYEEVVGTKQIATW